MKAIYKGGAFDGITGINLCQQNSIYLFNKYTQNEYY